MLSTPPSFFYTRLYFLIYISPVFSYTRCPWMISCHDKNRRLIKWMNPASHRIRIQISKIIKRMQGKTKKTHLQVPTNQEMEQRQNPQTTQLRIKPILRSQNRNRNLKKQLRDSSRNSINGWCSSEGAPCGILDDVVLVRKREYIQRSKSDPA